MKLLPWFRKSANGVAHAVRESQEEAVEVRKRIFTSTDRWFHLPSRLLEGDGGGEMTQPFREHAWIFASMSVKAENIAQVPYVLRRKSLADPEDQGTPLGPDSPLQRVFDEPNDDLDGPELWETGSIHLDHWGEMALVLASDEGGGYEKGSIPETISIVVPTALREDRDKKTGVRKRWLLRGTGKPVPLTNEQVIFIKLPNPYNPRRGIGPVEAARTRAAADHKAARWTESLMDNAGDPGGVITIEGNIDPDRDVPAFRQQWEDRHQGVDKIGRPAVLWGGAKYDKIGTNARDMAFPDLHAATIDAILAVMRVPKVVLAKVEDVNRNTALVSKRILWQEALIPRTTRFERVIQRRLIDPINRKSRTGGGVEGLSPRERIVGEFDLSGVEALKADFTEKLEQAEKLKELGFGLNAIAQRLDLDMEEVSWGDEPLSDPNRVPISLLHDLPGAFVPTPAGPTTAGESAERSVASSQPPPFSSTAVLSRRSWRDRFAERYERAFSHPAEKKILLGVRAYFRRIRTLQVAKIEEFRKKTGRRLPATSPLTQAEIADLLLAESTFAAEMETAVGTRLGEVAIASLDQLSAELGGFQVVTPSLEVPWVRRTVAQRIAQMVKLAKRDRTLIRSAIIRAISKGGVTDIGGIQKAVSESVRGMQQFRALRIARTESGMLANRTRFEGMKKEGVEKHEWVTARDSIVRPAGNPKAGANHQVLDGEIRAIGSDEESLFSNGLRFPLDPSSGNAAEVVNCRCVAVPTE